MLNLVLCIAKYILMPYVCAVNKKTRAFGATTFLAMKIKLKHIFYLAALSFAAMACGGIASKPLSGLDLSLIPIDILTVNPKSPDTDKTETEPLNFTKENVATSSAFTAKLHATKNVRDVQQQSTISNQQ